MIIGHQKQWNYLKKIAKSERIPHALLFSGGEHLGKKTIALEFIRLLFGRDFKSLKGHPDFILITPTESEIQIAQIRELIWKLSLKPSLAPIKAAIIDQAHLMNQEAQNCFLKTLEEPRGNTILILITEYPEMLFPTILSRCQIIKFYPIKKEEIENYFKNQGVKEGKIKEILEISNNKPGEALDFLMEPQKLEERIQRKKELVKILKSDLSFRFQYAKEISKESNLKEILNIWLSCFRENLLTNLNSKQPEILKKLKNILQKIQSTIFLISTTNVNPRLALEILMLEI